MLIAHPVAGKAKSRMICEAFIAGAPKGAHGHVFYGVNETNVSAWTKVKDWGEDWWYIDNSYFDVVRGRQFRVTKNRVQVDPQNRVSDGVRFAALGITLKPWKHNHDGHVVVIEQSPSFMRTVAMAPNWFHHTLLDLERERVVVRGWRSDKPQQQVTLLDDLSGAALLITHSSAAAVTAATEGVPIEVDRMSAMYGWPSVRLHTLRILADNQFTLDEMKEGVAWRWLNK